VMEPSAGSLQSFQAERGGRIAAVFRGIRVQPPLGVVFQWFDATAELPFE